MHRTQLAQMNRRTQLAQMNRQTDKRMDGQFDFIMPPKQKFLGYKNLTFNPFGVPPANKIIPKQSELKIYFVHKARGHLWPKR